jgi:hypothetical protein
MSLDEKFIPVRTFLWDGRYFFQEDMDLDTLIIRECPLFIFQVKFISKFLDNLRHRTFGLNSATWNVVWNDIWSIT